MSSLVRARAAVDASVRKHLEAANQYASKYANTRRRHLTFAPDDLILLKTTNLPIPTHLSRKLAHTWLGPLRVVEQVGPVAYRVQLPDSLARLHPVFHVSLLKPFVGSPPAARPPVFSAPDAEEFEVEKILAHRLVRGKRQFLVLWKGYPAHEATWEPERHLQNAPELLASYKEDAGLEGH